MPQLLDVSTVSVRKVWNDAGLKHRIAAKKTFLTPQHKMDLLIYAQINQHRNWDNVIFFDEKTFQSDRHQKMHCVLITAGMTMNTSSQHVEVVESAQGSGGGLLVTVLVKWLL